MSRKRLRFDKRRELARLVGRFTTTDSTLRDTSQLFSLFKLGIFTAGNPIQEVQFGAGKLGDEGGTYLTASPRVIKETVDDFLNAKPLSQPRTKLKSTAEDRAADRKRRKAKKNKASNVPGLEIAKTEGENQAIVGSTRIKFPFYFPTLRLTGARYASPEPRTYSMRDGAGKLHRAYRMVVQKGSVGEYYGIQGMSWRYPPILDNPDARETVDGRRLMLYYDGGRVRLVAWRTSNAAYYVHNTLTRSLSKRQMVAIAASLRRLGG